MKFTEYLNEEMIVPDKTLIKKLKDKFFKTESKFTGLSVPKLLVFLNKFFKSNRLVFEIGGTSLADDEEMIETLISVSEDDVTDWIIIVRASVSFYTFLTNKEHSSHAIDAIVLNVAHEYVHVEQLQRTKIPKALIPKTDNLRAYLSLPSEISAYAYQAAKELKEMGATKERIEQSINNKLYGHRIKSGKPPIYPMVLYFSVFDPDHPILKKLATQIYKYAQQFDLL